MALGNNLDSTFSVLDPGNATMRKKLIIWCPVGKLPMTYARWLLVILPLSYARMGKHMTCV
jgi:hypothetical protein